MNPDRSDSSFILHPSSFWKCGVCMSRQCGECSRVNPSEAAYCYHDGMPLNGVRAGDGTTVNFGTWTFPSPFVFPTGESCRNFIQLAQACLLHPQQTIEVLQHGFLES